MKSKKGTFNNILSAPILSPKQKEFLESLDCLISIEVKYDSNAHSPCDLCGKEMAEDIGGAFGVKSFPWNKTGIWTYSPESGYYNGDGSNAYLCSEECLALWEEAHS